MITLSIVRCKSRTDHDKASGTHLACLNKSWRNACRAHPRAFWSRAANAQLLRLVGKRKEPDLPPFRGESSPFQFFKTVFVCFMRF